MRASKDRRLPFVSNVSLAQAAAWMKLYSPDLKETIAAYETAYARAQVKTPLPNPSLEVGPEFGFGSGVEVNPVVPFGSLGITIPLGDRLARRDNLNSARAEVLRVGGLASLRELYLELRRRYLRLAIAHKVQGLRTEITAAARQSVSQARHLVEAGQATALDVALFELEGGRSQAQLLQAKAASARSRAELAALVGVGAAHFAQLPDNSLTLEVKSDLNLEGLKRLLTDNHPELARLRARYEEAECSLRLEIAEQYPDLKIGPSLAGDSGDHKTVLGLALGIELPLFDQNQQAIAEASQKREEIRMRYEAAANRALAEVERSFAALQLAKERRKILRDTILPSAKKSIDLARRSMAAGSADALRLLDAERSFRQVKIEALAANLAEREAWIDLEMSVGKPLVRIPGELDIARVPQKLRAAQASTGGHKK